MYIWHWCILPRHFIFIFQTVKRQWHNNNAVRCSKQTHVGRLDAECQASLTRTEQNSRALLKPHDLQMTFTEEHCRKKTRDIFTGAYHTLKRPALFYVKDETKTVKIFLSFSAYCVYRFNHLFLMWCLEKTGCFWMLLQLVFVKYMFLIILFLVVFLNGSSRASDDRGAFELFVCIHCCHNLLCFSR